MLWWFALTTKIQQLPEAVLRSLTLDQGPEMRDWEQVKIAADIDIFFATRTSPGSAGRMRTPMGYCAKYFPKGSDLAVQSARRPIWTRSPPNSTTVPGSDSASASRFEEIGHLLAA